MSPELTVSFTVKSFWQIDHRLSDLGLTAFHVRVLPDSEYRFTATVQSSQYSEAVKLAVQAPYWMSDVRLEHGGIVLYTSPLPENPAETEDD